MDEYQLLSHTADVRILARSDTLEGLFKAGLHGLCQVLYPGFETVSAEQTYTTSINITSPDETSLLIDFLSHSLSLMYRKKILFIKCEIKQLTSNSLTADISGFPVGGFTEDVKAVTYHEAEIIKNANGEYQSVIILDI